MIHFEKRDQYLFVTSEGERKSLIGMQEGAKTIHSFIESTKSPRVLIDYRKVNFNIQNTDTFNMIRFYEAKLPLTKKVAIAVVLNEENMQMGKTWKEMAAPRGFNFNVFREVSEAEDWLLKQG